MTLIYRIAHIDRLASILRSGFLYSDAAVSDWAAENGLRVSFSDENAASATAVFRSDVSQVGKLDWDAIKSDDWRGRMSEKQAEFLVESRVPAYLVQRIGVIDAEVQETVREILWQADLPNLPVDVIPEWYY